MGFSITGTVLDSDVAVGAGIDSGKLKHQTVFTVDFGYADADGSVATGARTFAVMDVAGKILSARAWLVDSGTNTDIDFDLEKNGATALTGDINVVHGTGDQTAVDGTVSSATLASGDYLTAKIKTVTQNTGALGPRMQITVAHDPLST